MQFCLCNLYFVGYHVLLLNFVMSNVAYSMTNIYFRDIRDLHIGQIFCFGLMLLCYHLDNWSKLRTSAILRIANTCSKISIEAWVWLIDYMPLSYVDVNTYRAVISVLVQLIYVTKQAPGSKISNRATPNQNHFWMLPMYCLHCVHMNYLSRPLSKTTT